jgi:hypothetical protein
VQQRHAHGFIIVLRLTPSANVVPMVPGRRELTALCFCAGFLGRAIRAMSSLPNLRSNALMLMLFYARRLRARLAALLQAG